MTNLILLLICDGLKKDCHITLYCHNVKIVMTLRTPTVVAAVMTALYVPDGVSRDMLVLIAIDSELD